MNCYSPLLVEIIQKFGLSGITVFRNSPCFSIMNQIVQLNEVSNQSEDVSFGAFSLLVDILCVEAEAMRAKNKPNEGVNKIAFDAKHILDDHLYSRISDEELAKRLYVSKTHLIRSFSSVYKTTPHAYLLDQKIKLAKVFLQTGLGVEEISYRLSFPDPHYFSRIFKFKVGMSPKQFKSETRATMKPIVSKQKEKE